MSWQASAQQQLFFIAFKHLIRLSPINLRDHCDVNKNISILALWNVIWPKSNKKLSFPEIHWVCLLTNLKNISLENLHEKGKTKTSRIRNLKFQKRECFICKKTNKTSEKKVFPQRQRDWNKEKVKCLIVCLRAESLFCYQVDEKLFFLANWCKMNRNFLTFSVYEFAFVSWELFSVLIRIYCVNTHEQSVEKYLVWECLIR